MASSPPLPRFQLPPFHRSFPVLSREGDAWTSLCAHVCVYAWQVEESPLEKPRRRSFRRVHVYRNLGRVDSRLCPIDPRELCFRSVLPGKWWLRIALTRRGWWSRTRKNVKWSDSFLGKNWYECKKNGFLCVLFRREEDGRIVEIK